MRKIVFALIASMLMLAGSAAFAEEPMRNVSPKRHPNLAAAQRLSQKAFEKITAAQQANEWTWTGMPRKQKNCSNRLITNERSRRSCQQAQRP